ncbi:MAG: cobalamin-independent methionine synthase II family protein [Anaerolineales bacterium]
MGDESPSILTTVVGSYPVPEWLRVHPTKVGLRDATTVVVHTQELAGIDVVADGELYRYDLNHPETNGMIDYFVGRMDGIERRISRADIAEFRSDSTLDYRAEPAGVVTGALGPGILNLPMASETLLEIARHRTKFTVTSPYMLSKVLLDRKYGDRRALAMAIAEVLADQVAELETDVVQIDEANVTGAPEDGPWAAEAINIVLDRIPGTAAVHLCFGNYGGQTIQRGHYEQLIMFINALHADHVILETARRDPKELDYLRGVEARIGIGLGVIDIKDNEVEGSDVVAARIERAERVLGPGRVRYVHPDCGFWMLPRSVADAKMAALVRGRDQYLGTG